MIILEKPENWIGNRHQGIKKRVWKESLISCILVLWLESEKNCYESIMCLKVWICLFLLFDDKNISDHRVVSVCIFSLSQFMFDLRINKPLVSSFGQGISSLQSSEFSFSMLCLYTIKKKKIIKAESFWHLAWKRNESHGSWNEGDLQKNNCLPQGRQEACVWKKHQTCKPTSRTGSEPESGLYFCWLLEKNSFTFYD